MNKSSGSIEYDLEKTDVSQIETTEVAKVSPEIKLISAITLQHPEMRWLTGAVDASPEKTVSEGDESKNIGEIIFPNLSKDELVEFNRTAVGLLCLHWAYDGGDEAYQKFTECQVGSVYRLTRENFELLHGYTRSILPSQKDLDALIVYTVINDLGKIHAIVEQIQVDAAKDFSLRNVSHEKAISSIVEYAIRENLEKIAEIVQLISDEVSPSNVDHDKVLLNGLETNSEISPGFYNLGDIDQEKILTGLRGEFNMGQFLQAENLPASLEKLRGMDEKSYDFYMIHFLFDLAGAAGQFVQKGSVVLDNPTFEGFLKGQEIVKEYVSLDKQDEATTYRKFLQEMVEPYGIDIDTTQGYAIARLARMMRVKSQEDIDVLTKTFFEKLGSNSKAILEKELGMTGINDGYGTLLYYGPAIIGNLQKELGKEDGLELGLTTLARVCQEARIHLKNRSGNGVFTLMMNSVAKIASKSPRQLYNTEFDIIGIGDDGLVSPIKREAIDLTYMTERNVIKDLNTQIPGKRIVLGGIGGGSDAVQATQVAKLLEGANKEIPFIFSVRTKTTSSQGPDGKSGQDRTPENAEQVLPGIYKITGETLMNGRAVEPLIAEIASTYLIMIDGKEEQLSSRIDSLVELLGGADTIIGVDTGGDALYGTGIDLDQAKSTPDQDLLVLQALEKTKSTSHVLSCEIALGVDSPKNASEVLSDGQAVVYRPNEKNIEEICLLYTRLGMDGSSDTHFGKTALSWQAALRGKTGVTELPLPNSVVVDPTNPWNPYVYIQDPMKSIFFMKASRHTDAIINKENSLF